MLLEVFNINGTIGIVYNTANPAIYLGFLILCIVIIVYEFFHSRRIAVSLSVLLAAFIFLTFEININNTLFPDLRIYYFVIQFKNNVLTVIMKFITNFGSAKVLASAATAFLLFCCLRRKYLLYGIMSVFNLASAALFNLSLKAAVQRPRPDIAQLIHAGGYSFPSSHSLCSVTFYGFLIFFCVRFCKKPLKQIFTVLLTLLILSVGLSRIYLGVHYPSDVAGGYLSGAICLIISICIIDFFEKKFRGGK